MFFSVHTRKYINPSPFIPPSSPHQPPTLHSQTQVGTLLRHPDPALQILGTHLLLSFSKIPGSSTYLKQLDMFVPRVCENARGGGSKCAKQGPLQHLATTMKHMAAKDAGVVPHAALLLQLTSLHALAVGVGVGKCFV